MEDIIMSKKFNFNAYSVNKYSEGIVYTFADGTVVEIKLSTVMESDSSVTLEKFQKLKCGCMWAMTVLHLQKAMII